MWKELIGFLYKDKKLETNMRCRFLRVVQIYSIYVLATNEKKRQIENYVKYIMGFF